MDKKILNKLNINKEQLERICKKNYVKNLFIFGSINSDFFKKDYSDIDFLVEFSNVTFDNYFNLLEELQKLFNYEKIDLVTIDSIKNQIIREEINSKKKILYAA